MCRLRHVNAHDWRKRIKAIIDAKTPVEPAESAPAGHGQPEPPAEPTEPTEPTAEREAPSEPATVRTEYFGTWDKPA